MGIFFGGPGIAEVRTRWTLSSALDAKESVERSS